ncbi:armadillo-type protein [Mycena vulgaris]|nr:armadillo-type protein [Mycena vulgaris]
MNSLTRQRTPESVRSWWSDSNPTGPNINLHALAKPLMKLMYHRQALDYIAEHRDSGKPLSRGDLEIYASYLGVKYVSSATKIAVLSGLTAKVNFQNDADNVADFLILYPLGILLESRNVNVRGSACHLLVALARRCSSCTGTWAASFCKQLVLLLRSVIEWAAYALRLIASSPAGAQAEVHANVLDYVAELFDSPNDKVRKWACSMLESLAIDETAMTGILRMKLCERMVLLLRDESNNVREEALFALRSITRNPNGAQAIIDAHMLDSVVELVESSNSDVRWQTCQLLRALASQNVTTSAVMMANWRKQLVLLLRDKKFYVRVVDSAAEAPSCITISTEGIQAVVSRSQMLQHMQLCWLPWGADQGIPLLQIIAV